MAVVEKRFSEEIEDLSRLKHHYDDLFSSGFSAIDILNESDPDTLAHYGKGHLDGGHSGRYPYGSGEDPYQHEDDLYTRINHMRKVLKMDDIDICNELGFKSKNELGKAYSNARAEHRNNLRERVLSLRQDGYSRQAIADKLGLSGESYVRNLENEALANRTNLTNEKADELRAFVDENKYIDITSGTELQLGITASRMDKVVAKLQEEGYQKMYVKVNQMGTNHQTTIKCLVPPGTTYKELYEHRYDIKYPNQKVVDEDTGRTKLGLEPPVSVSLDRIQVAYAEDGGIEKDGLIELRRGVPDISLGKAQYAQVRIAVNGTHYMKGMARYTDDLPPGIDIRYNSNKHRGTPICGEDKRHTVMKPMSNDPDNPFGATIKGEEDLTMCQKHYTDPVTGEKKTSCINIVNEQGAWDKWRRSLPSQFLSKQPEQLAKKQLDLAYASKLAEHEEIMSLTNPTIKRKLLAEFADGCDKASVDLKAAALPRQAAKVILPYPEISENDIYAPGYREGEQVALVRFPHGGTFEIPTLTVRNKNSPADATIHNAIDAVGINSKVAERLSGADFDGDSVLVIPINDRVRIRTKDPLPGLKGFDTKEAYPGYPGMKLISEKEKNKQMGITTNLITDMTLKGATDEELTRAVKHSMVIIDSEKHGLDWKRSERENRIPELKRKYQTNPETGKRGAGTLISRAKNPVYVPERKEMTGINTVNTDPITGKRIYKYTGDHYTKRWNTTKHTKDGDIDIPHEKVVWKQTKSNQMTETDDAFKLSSGTRMENIYAEHANKLKALANQSRLEYLNTPRLTKNPEAAKTYADEIDILNAKLRDALGNSPRERQAQLRANKVFDEKMKANPDMDKKTQKKIKNQAISESRILTGANKKAVQIEITDREWDAIQAGAISDSALMRILDNTDTEKLKQRAMPRTANAISPGKENKIRAMEASGYSLSEIADSVGLSASTVSNLLNGQSND